MEHKISSHEKFIYLISTTNNPIFFKSWFHLSSFDSNLADKSIQKVNNRDQRKRKNFKKTCSKLRIMKPNLEAYSGLCQKVGWTTVN